MSKLLSWYTSKLPVYLVYMLQQVDYRPAKFVAWLKRRPAVNRVMQRQSLDHTSAARLLVRAGYISWGISGLVGLGLLAVGSSLGLRLAGGLLVIGSPLVVCISLILVAWLARRLIIGPQEQTLIAESRRVFLVHPGIKIAVAGSYGKTTFKEVLAAVLKEKYKLAVTPGNMNTPIAHARFASKLAGDEQVLILEYGEEHPGDTKKFLEVTRPDYAVLLGLAPNHLDYYKTLEALAKDLLSLRTLGAHLYINGESPLLKKYLKKTDNVFTAKHANNWKIENIKVTISGTSFTLISKKQQLHITSGLLGRHHVAPLAMAASLAGQLGLSTTQIEAGLARTQPFEHRMQPRRVAGATVLDDTYNGNIEGILAGLELLKELPAQRKMYVTPGLVDQGAETETVHHQVAKKLFDVKPDLIVLMDNSATKIIETALAKLNYQGLIQVETDPLNFYQNLDKVVAAGDLVLLQNDWTDNYN